MGHDTRWRPMMGLVVVLGFLSACSGQSENGTASDATTWSPSVSSSAVVPRGTVPPPGPAASQTATVRPSAEPASTTATCQRFGSRKDVASRDPLALSELTGASMRVGRHDCYERFVFEMAGSGDDPGWYVGYRDPITYQGSGDEVVVLGGADLAITVGVWTVTDFEGRPAEWPPFTGPDAIVTRGFQALREVRNLYAFEGTTQIALGVDRRRPFRVMWLEGPARLVVDIYTGRPLS